MKNLFYLFLFSSLLVTSTQVWAQGQYNSQDRTYEMSYDDLVEELSTQKKAVTESRSDVWGFSQVRAIFGYSFSSMGFNLGNGVRNFHMSGIDVRANGQFIDSAWQLEGGFKNYTRASNSNTTAESRILTLSMRNQSYLTSSLQFVMGASTSLLWIKSRKSGRSREQLDTTLNVNGGLRGSLSSQLSWGIDLNAYSPVSGNTLKKGYEAVVLLSSVL